MPSSASLASEGAYGGGGLQLETCLLGGALGILHSARDHFGGSPRQLRAASHARRPPSTSGWREPACSRGVPPGGARRGLCLLESCLHLAGPCWKGGAGLGSPPSLLPALGFLMQSLSLANAWQVERGPGRGSATSGHKAGPSIAPSCSLVATREAPVWKRSQALHGHTGSHVDLTWSLRARAEPRCWEVD